MENRHPNIKMKIHIKIESKEGLSIYNVKTLKEAIAMLENEIEWHSKGTTIVKEKKHDKKKK